jgi:DNA-binding XRE family transcriptional regulator
VEHREAELREVVPSGVPGDNAARFLRELRQLRNDAGLEQAELAARAHYPCDAILAAEAGPALPDLPVLSAYVRGCGGTVGSVTEWEERWRTLTRSPALTLLPTRSAGCSDAAAAGARIGSVSLAADAHDPAIIMAALGRVANGIASEPAAPVRVHSFFTPASSDPAPSQASVFAVDSAPPVAAVPSPVAAVPDADEVPEDTAALVGAADESEAADAAAPAAPAPAAAASGPGWTPSIVKPVSVAGRAPHAGRPTLTKPVIAVIAILVCLGIAIWALFS